jgi:ankyrin repeat protein
VSIQHAAKTGDIDQLKRHFYWGTDVNTRDDEGYTALDRAAEGGHADVAKLLIAKGADVNAKDQEGGTPLHSAALVGQADVAKLLIDNGADVNATIGTLVEGVIAPRYKEDITPLYFAAIRGHVEVVRLLIANGADVNITAKTKGTVVGTLYGAETPLGAAATRGHMEVVKLLIANGADVNMKKDGVTSLHWATEKGQTEIVKLLIAKGVDVNAKHATGTTPLHRAAEKGQTEIVKLLIAKGADVNARAVSVEGMSNITPLHWAAEKGHTETVKFLIAGGADVNARHTKGDMPLHWAAEKGHTEVVKLLIAKGADVNARAVSNEGTRDLTALHWAAHNGHTETVKFLIAKGADAHTKDKDGDTLLDVAAQKGHKDLVELLRQHEPKERHMKSQDVIEKDKDPAVIEGATSQVPEPSHVREAQSAFGQKPQADQAAPADTPPIKTGDTYIIESLYPDNPKLNSTTERKVISVGDGKITVASKNIKSIKSKTGKARMLQFTKEWNFISSRNPDRSGLDYSPPLKYFEFPLYPGRTWRQTSIEKNIKTGAAREHTLSATVGDWEDVSVPAGVFRAIKITTRTELLDRATGQKSTGTDISWYAPPTRRSVKSVINSQNFQGNQERQLIQMIQYDLK